MTITKEEILLHLNKELNRSETDATIAEYILGALKDISLQDKFIWFETTVPTIIGRAYYSLPTDYKKLLTIKIADNAPLDKITWTEYQNFIADQTVLDYGEPKSFAIHGGFWYPYYTPDAVYPATLFYNAFVPESEVIDSVTVLAVDNIGRYFSDAFRDVIYAKTKALYCWGLGWDDRAMKYDAIYEKRELPLVQNLIKREPKFVKCNDL